LKFEEQTTFFCPFKNGNTKTLIHSKFHWKKFMIRYTLLRKKRGKTSATATIPL
jgi:hypothetical protein